MALEWHVTLSCKPFDTMETPVFGEYTSVRVCRYTEKKKKRKKEQENSHTNEQVHKLILPPVIDL